LLAESNPLLVGVCTLLAELEHISSAVEKLIRHYPGTEYQHKRGHTSNIVQDTEKIPLSVLKITLQQGEGQMHQMARPMLGDFHINLQLPLSHI
jgi:hypothetical protein